MTARARIPKPVPPPADGLEPDERDLFDRAYRLRRAVAPLVNDPRVMQASADVGSLLEWKAGESRLTPTETIAAAWRVAVVVLLQAFELARRRDPDLRLDAFIAAAVDMVAIGMEQMPTATNTVTPTHEAPEHHQ